MKESDRKFEKLLKETLSGCHARGDSEPLGQDDGCIGDTACSYRVWQCVPAGEAEGFFRSLKLFPGVILQPERPPAKGLRED